MAERCHPFEDLLVASTLHDLSAADQKALEDHLRECDDCRAIHLTLHEDDQRLIAFVDASDAVLTKLEGKVMETIAKRDSAESATSGRAGESAGSSAAPISRVPRWLGRSPAWLRFAAAAAIIAVVAIGVSLLDRGPSVSIAWARVLERVVEAENYICRLERRSNLSPNLDIVQYCSSEHGVRQDMYRGDNLVAAVYVVPDEMHLVTLVHRDKKYTTMEMTEDQMAEALGGSSAQAFVERFRELEYEELGLREIDGVMASGIETEARELWGGVFDEGTARLWVDVETQWPIRFEYEGRADGGKVWADHVMKDFHWNASLSAEDFAFEIPDDYANLGTVGRQEINEEGAIEGLRDFARLMEGRYPSQLVAATAFKEFEDAEADLRRRGVLNDGDIPKLLSIQQTCSFFSELEEAERDPAYYGRTTRSTDFERVLLRWRLDDGRYRVIYGNLRTETVDAERLANLESR